MTHSLEIVVVDDEEQITELLKTFILCIAKELRVHTFNDSLEAKNFLLSNPVDILITDYKMPHINGLQLMESVPQKIRKIMISGYVSEVAEEKLQSLNATFFEKPVPMRALAKIIAEEQAKAK